MKKFVIVLTMLVALFGVNQFSLLAGEHGGTSVSGGGEHGGTAMEGSHSHAESHVATLREAASILTASHPDLAAKLEAIAAEEEKE